MRLEIVRTCLFAIALLASNAAAAGDTMSEVGGPVAVPPAPPAQLKAPGKKTDQCGNTIVAEEGSVTYKLEKVKSGPNKGKKCFSAITVGSDDKATITLASGSDTEITVSGEGEATINVDDAGDKADGVDEDPEDSEPGITVKSDGNGKSSVTVNGNNNVISVVGQEHGVSVNGNGNWVFVPGNDNSVSTSGDDNIVYT